MKKYDNVKLEELRGELKNITIAMEEFDERCNKNELFDSLEQFMHEGCVDKLKKFKNKNGNISINDIIYYAEGADKLYDIFMNIQDKIEELTGDSHLATKMYWEIKEELGYIK